MSSAVDTFPADMRSPSQDTAKPLSPSQLPELVVLPVPLSADTIPLGQFVSTTNKKHNPGAALADRDYDDLGARWYKDVVLIDENTGRFKDSLGGVMYIPKPQSGTAVGTIEAREMRVRMLKDPSTALFKVLHDETMRDWLRDEAKKGEVGFVCAIREVINASYKRASLVDRGAGSWEVVREVGGEDSQGKRRDSGLDVDTGSKRDVVGVLVRRIIVDGDNVGLGEDDMGSGFWS